VSLILCTKGVILLLLDHRWLAGCPRTVPVPGLGTWGSKAGFCGNMLAASAEPVSRRRKETAVANTACLDQWQVTCSASGNCCQLLPMNGFQGFLSSAFELQHFGPWLHEVRNLQQHFTFFCWKIIQNMGYLNINTVLFTQRRNFTLGFHPTSRPGQ